MRRLLTAACWLLALGGALTSCSIMTDEPEDCDYGCWLQLHYTYNILDVEAAPKYVKDATVYVYDSLGQYVKRIVATQEELAQQGYRVKVDGLEPGDYDFVVWSGAGASAYTVAGDTRRKGDFRLSLTQRDGTSAKELPALFHGQLTTAHCDNTFAEYYVELMKNTNQLACLVVPVTAAPTPLSADDYTMKLVTANSVMDATNRPTATATTTYEPYEQEAVTLDDAEYGELHGVRYSLSTLRLMGDRSCRLVLEKTATGEELLSISLPEFVGQMGTLYTNLGRPLTVQEYLDRQDFYTLVFFVTGDLEQLLQLQVNSWRLRAFNHIKL